MEKEKGEPPDVETWEDAKTIVFEFRYNSDCCESAPHTESIHKTRKGAEIAMEFHKNEVKKQWEISMKNESRQKRKRCPFDFNQWWVIRPTELKD